MAESNYKLIITRINMVKDHAPAVDHIGMCPFVYTPEPLK